MNKSLIVVSLLAGLFVVGMLVHFGGQRSSTEPVVVAEVGDASVPATPPRDGGESGEARPESLPQSPNEPMLDAEGTRAVDPKESEEIVGQTASYQTPFRRAIDTIVSPQASFQQKHEAWEQLQESGQLDQAMEALKQGAAENPEMATYPAALGRAQLYKAGIVSRSGGTISEMGILGMQADQNFDAALGLDPANWEAQFFKAAAMSHWPLELNKGHEVIERLARLIDQQDTLMPQPEFAQAYVVLGDQYQKMGQPEYAAATWEVGVRKFPGDSTLRQRIGLP